MQAWIMTKLIRKKDIKEELWWVIPSRNMLRRVSLLHITVENFQIYTYFSFNEWERSIIWYKIKYLKKSRKKAEIEYILGDIVFGELGSCQLWQWHCIVVSRIHHGSQCHLNINDGFWILGWRLFGGLSLTRNEWISIISRSLATENVPGRGESSVHLCLQPRLPLRRQREIQQSGFLGLGTLCGTKPRDWQYSGVLVYIASELGASARAATEEGWGEEVSLRFHLTQLLWYVLTSACSF